MSWLSEIQAGSDSILVIAAALAAVSVLETALPLAPRGPWNRRHLAPNLALGGITLATNLVFSAGLVILLGELAASRIGLFPALGLAGPAELVVALLGLDFSYYLAHVAMHKFPLLWRFHAVHHADPAVDATTTLRQHPGETVIRFAFTIAFACALGAGPAAYLVYRSVVALNGLLEHANLRLPRRVDDLLALVTTWSAYHKVHHSRIPAQTDTNYGNLFSWWDRIFGTATPARVGERIDYGLDGLEDEATQSLAGLLALPFRAERGSKIAIDRIGATSS